MNKKKIITILIILVIMIVIGINIFIFSYKGIDDYYNYINKEYIDSLVLESDEVGKSKFTIYQDKVNDDVKEITKKMIRENDYDKELYNLYVKSKRDNNTIFKYMNYIDKSKDINDFIDRVMNTEDELKEDILMTLSISKDIKDNKNNIVYLEPIKFDFDISSYMYNNDDYASVISIMKGYQIKLMKLYGYDNKKARSISDKIFEMEKDIAKHTISYNDLTNVDNLYHKITIDELQNIYTNINVKKYFKMKGISNQEYYSIVDKNNYEVFNKYLTNDNLDLLKEFVKFRILENYSSYMTLDYSKLVYELNNKISGINKEFNLEENALDFVNSINSNEIEKEYVKLNHKDSNKELLTNMINEMIDYYKDDINSLEWMSSKTKEKAILKLDNMTINISKDISKYKIKKYKINSKISLVDNIINFNRDDYNDYLDLLENDDDVQLIGETVFNAYYNVQNNSINFPTAFENILDESDNYYEKLGTVGMIIAHEITHAFDNNGALFDEKGNYNNWWDQSDFDKFSSLKDNIIDYYSNYKVNGVNINGKLTVGENIADLGSINCITSIAKKHNATKDDLKKMYSSFAKMWASKYNKSYQKLLLSSDTHSPDKIRVNAVLSSCDEFYKTYNINIFDKMFVNEEDRVGIW